jgi:hypothetical protein
MAERLVSGGDKVVVYNRTASVTAPFRGRAEIASTPAQAADMADIVFACLKTAESCREVILGPNGLIHGRRAKLYVHTGTNGVALLEELAAGLGRRGIAMLDAPITGGVSGAERGMLTVMASGPRDAFERAVPHFKHYASKVVYVGERIGAAQMTKLVNNALSGANLAMACEALVVGCKAGVDPAAMLEAINHGTGQSNATQTKIPDQVLTRAFNQRVSIGELIEIMEIFCAEARQGGVPVPLAEAVIASFKAAAAAEGGAADLTALIRPLERAAGVTVGRSDKTSRGPMTSPQPDNVAS